MPKIIDAIKAPATLKFAGVAAAGIIIGGTAVALIPHNPATVEDSLQQSVAQTQDVEQSKPTQLLPDSVGASCGEGSTVPVDALDDDISTAWICNGWSPAGTDHQLNIIFNVPTTITSLKVAPGWNYTDNENVSHWDEHPAITQIEWEIGGFIYQQDIDPTNRNGSTFDIPGGGVETETLHLRVTSVAPSETSNPNSFAIEKLVINGFQ